MSKLTEMTGQSQAHLMARVQAAYKAKFGKDATGLSLTNPTEGEWHLNTAFSVRKGGKTIGKAEYRPRRESVSVHWS